jgi:hypothetical protein
MYIPGEITLNIFLPQKSLLRNKQNISFFQFYPGLDEVQISQFQISFPFPSKNQS